MKTKVDYLKENIDNHEIMLDKHWQEDIWDLKTGVYEVWNPDDKSLNGHIDFKILNNESLRDEFKEYLYEKISQRIIIGNSIDMKFKFVTHVLKFIEKYYPNCKSMMEINISKALVELRSYYTKERHSNFNIKKYVTTLDEVFEYVFKRNDTRDEYEKDIWDIRNIYPSKMALGQSKYHLNFTKVPSQFSNLTKKYLRVRINGFSLGHCESLIYHLRMFFTFILEKYENWVNLNNLSRDDIENYMVWAREWYRRKNVKTENELLRTNLINIRTFIDYIQRSEYDEAPKKSLNMLIFKEDFPKKPE